MLSNGAVRRIGAVSGILGPLALAVYFAAPAVTGWPYAGASDAQLTGYALNHQALFFAGAWFQATGTLLSMVMFLAIVHLAGAASRLFGLLTIVASAVLLSVVLVEAAFLVAVPLAATAGDMTTVATTFALSNGVFVRIFPLAPASASFIGLGGVILESGLLDRRLGYLALALGSAFELAGLLAIFTVAGLFLAIALSLLQGLWILAAGAALAMSARRPAASAGA